MSETWAEKARRVADELTELYRNHPHGPHGSQFVICVDLRKGADAWDASHPTICKYCRGTGQETRDFALKGEPPVIGGYRIGPCRKGCTPKDE